jgi:hypothetical protein
MGKCLKNLKAQRETPKRKIDDILALACAAAIFMIIVVAAQVIKAWW